MQISVSKNNCVCCIVTICKIELFDITFTQENIVKKVGDLAKRTLSFTLLFAPPPSIYRTINCYKNKWRL